MPKIRRTKLPPALLDHLLQRARERRIGYEQMEEMYLWFASNPTVPDGAWFKRFPNFTICGEDDLIKTFLESGQLPFGKEVI